MSLLTLAQRPAPGVNADVSVQKSVAAFRKARSSALLVLNQRGKMVGIVSERDLVRRVVGKGLDPRTTKVADVMTPRVDTVGANATPEEAFVSMSERHIRHLVRAHESIDHRACPGRREHPNEFEGVPSQIQVSMHPYVADVGRE